MVKKLPVWIEKDEFVKLIKATTQPHHKLAFLLGFGAGMRVSEVQALQPINVNIKD